MTRVLARLAVFALLLFGIAVHAWSLPLWELQGEADNIRLLGSIHFLRADDYPLPDAIGAAYREAEVLVTEIDLDDLDPLEAQASMQSLAIDPRGRDLARLLGPADYATVRTAMQALAIDPAALAAYEPWYAALQVTQLRLQQLGFNPGYGVEARLLMLAASDGKEIRGLETLEDQLGALDSLPASAQREFLLTTIEEAAEIESGIDAILLAWREGNTRTLERDLLSGLDDQPELRQRILVDRNGRWVEQLQAMAGDGTRYLVVVGALHLVGPDSVLDMLERRGIGNQQLRE
jgi:uncharacterized protein YbaP (TraB family)